MELKEFFEKYKFIAPARLAAKMYNTPSAKQHFNNKLKQHVGQRILKTDVEKALVILKKMASDVKKIKIKDSDFE